MSAAGRASIARAQGNELMKSLTKFAAVRALTVLAGAAGLMLAMAADAGAVSDKVKSACKNDYYQFCPQYALSRQEHLARLPPRARRRGRTAGQVRPLSQRGPENAVSGSRAANLRRLPRSPLTRGVSHLRMAPLRTASYGPLRADVKTAGARWARFSAPR
jgi:hypothetical protein